MFSTISNAEINHHFKQLLICLQNLNGLNFKIMSFVEGLGIGSVRSSTSFEGGHFRINPVVELLFHSYR